MKGRGPHCWCGGMCYLCEGLGTGVEETRSSTSLCCAVTAKRTEPFSFLYERVVWTWHQVARGPGRAEGAEGRGGGRASRPGSRRVGLVAERMGHEWQRERRQEEEAGARGTCA